MTNPVVEFLGNLKAKCPQRAYTVLLHRAALASKPNEQGWANLHIHPRCRNSVPLGSSETGPFRCGPVSSTCLTNDHDYPL
jgi:hypothetical protein